jgi:hypothetical protein
MSEHAIEIGHDDQAFASRNKSRTRACSKRSNVAARGGDQSYRYPVREHCLIAVNRADDAYNARHHAARESGCSNFGAGFRFRCGNSSVRCCMMVTLVNDRAELPACSCVSPRR